MGVRILEYFRYYLHENSIASRWYVLEHIANHMLHTRMTWSPGDDLRKVEIDTLNVRMPCQNPHQSGSVAPSNVHQLPHVLEASVLGQNHRQQLIRMICHRRLEAVQLVRVGVHVMKCVRPER